MSLIEEALRRTRHAITAPPQPPPRANGQTEQVREASGQRSQSMADHPASAVTNVAFGFLGASTVVALAVGAAIWTHKSAVQSRPGSEAPGPTMGSVIDAAGTVGVGAEATAAEPSPRGVAQVPRSAEQPFELSGVVEGTGESFAIINGHIVAIGDTIDGATLLEVKDHTATLRWEGEELVLRTAR